MKTNELNPKELRIGNLIASAAMKGIYSAVVVMTADRVNGSNQKYYNPIPLTEDWLLEFGFTTDWNDGGKPVLRTEWKVKDLTVFYHTRGLDKKTACLWHDIGFETGVKIRYVHQLQNLYFALTGRELELVNSEKKY